MSLQQQPKTPPFSLEAEQSVLGGVMLHNDSMADVLELLQVDDFYREDHRLIFTGLKDLFSKRQPLDFITVSAYFEKRNQIDNVGGMAYLGMLANDTPSAANVKAYAEIVRERALLRQVIAVGSDIAELGFRPDGATPAELLDLIEQKAFALRRRNAGSKGPEAYSTIMDRVYAKIDANAKAGSLITGLETGLYELDMQTGGFQPTDLILIAGRPSMGKSALAGSIADYVAITQRKATLVFTMEMASEQWCMRSVANIADIPLQLLKSGQLDDRQLDRMMAADPELREAPLLLDETGALSPFDIRARARRVAAKYPLGMIVVDYIQLMQVPGTKENRTTEISEISRNLKALAKELQLPVVALSQLNRGVEQRDNKRPRMSDLRESGGLEQDADVVMFVYRDEVYNPESQWKGTAELIIAKQRNGPLGTVRTKFEGQYTRFSNLAPDYEPPAGTTTTPPPRRGGFGGAANQRPLV